MLNARPRKGIVYVVGLLLSTMLPTPIPAVSRGIGPDADLCAEINATLPGDELVLRPGNYQGPCTIRRGGTPGAPVVIRAHDLQHRPRLVYSQRPATVLESRAN